MKKTLPLRHYFNRARLFGYLLAAIGVAILIFFALSIFS
jgi:hypothetical protein